MSRIVSAALAVFLACAPAFAQTGRLDDMRSSDPSLDLERVNSKNLTPSERIRLNALKAQRFPELRGRWDPSYHEAASMDTAPVDNLAQAILEHFRSDPGLSEQAVWLKVTTLRGDVTLEGYAADAGQRDLISDKVARMDGVRSVDNRLRIGRPDEFQSR